MSTIIIPLLVFHFLLYEHRALLTPTRTRKTKNMSNPSGQSSTTTVGGNGGGSGSNGGGGGSGGGSGSGSFGNQPQRSKVRKQVWAGVLGISSVSTNN